MDLDFRDLPVEVSCHKGLAQEFDAAHPTLDTVPEVVSAPSSPQGAAQVLRCVYCLFAVDDPGARRAPEFDVLARRNDSMRISGGIRIMAFAGVMEPIDGDRSNVLAGRDLGEQLR